MSLSVNNTVNQNMMYWQLTKGNVKGADEITKLGRARSMVSLNNMDLDSLSAARGKPISRAVDAGRFDNIDFSKAIASNNPARSGGVALQQESYIIAQYAGRDFHLYDPENAKYLDDPTVRVTETGYLVRQSETRGGTATGSLNCTIQILGKAVDAPEYSPPKYTADFFDAKTDFIMKAAHEYAKTGADETFTKPQYSSDHFIQAMLGFFSQGKALPSDMANTKTSIESIIKELAEMIKSGEGAELDKVKGKVDIMGEKVSIMQFLEMQEYGKELSNKLAGENNEWLRFGSDRIGDFAHRGLIKSLGMAYGDQIGGTIGEMFKTAWGSEVDRHSEIIKNMIDNIVEQGIVSAGHADMLKNGADWINDVFSKVDMSSKDSAVESYKALSGEIDAAIHRFTDQYTGGAPKNETIRSEVDSYFYNLMEIKSVDTLA